MGVMGDNEKGDGVMGVRYVGFGFKAVALTTTALYLVVCPAHTLHTPSARPLACTHPKHTHTHTHTHTHI